MSDPHDELTAAERRAMLNRYGVRYVLAPDPAMSLDLNPAGLGLEPVWSGEQATLYRVGETP